MKTKLWALAGLLIAIVYCFVEADGYGDFYIFVSASAWLDGHTDIYAHRFLIDYHYYYSVLFALLLKPFYYLPFFWVKFCWLMLNLFLYYKLFRLLAGAAFLNALQPKQKNYFLLAVSLFSFRFLHENIHNSQITILILWCCVYGIYYIQSGKTVSGSLILALGINIKLLPIVLLPYLLYRGYFKAFGITLSAYILSLLAPGLIIGNKYNTDLLECWFILINPTKTQHLLDVDERSFHSLTTLLSTLFVENVPDTHAMAIKRNIANVSLGKLATLILAVRLCLVAFTLYFLKLKPFKKAGSVGSDCAALSYILLLVPLIFPHQQHYAFLFTVPAFAWVTFTLISNYRQLPRFKARLITATLVIIYLVCNLKILLGEFNHYYEHFKILTYGALLLIPLLIWSSRINHRGTESSTSIGI